MDLLNDQFIKAGDAEDQVAPAINAERESRHDRKGHGLNLTNNTFNENSLLKELMQEEISEGM